MIDQKGLVDLIFPYLDQDTKINLDMQETLRRVNASWKEILSGYQMNIHNIMSTRFKNESTNKASNVIQIKDIPYYSVCEHHLLPFFGTVNISYEPDKYILGLSKFGRLVDVYARRLQLQERMTKQIANQIMGHLKPHWVKVSVKASHHLCMAMRGVKKDSNLETEMRLEREDEEN